MVRALGHKPLCRIFELRDLVHVRCLGLAFPSTASLTLCLHQPVHPRHESGCFRYLQVQFGFSGVQPDYGCEVDLYTGRREAFVVLLDTRQLIDYLPVTMVTELSVEVVPRALS